MAHLVRAIGYGGHVVAPILCRSNTRPLDNEIPEGALAVDIPPCSPPYQKDDKPHPTPIGLYIALVAIGMLLSVLVFILFMSRVQPAKLLDPVDLLRARNKSQDIIGP